MISLNNIKELGLKDTRAVYSAGFSDQYIFDAPY